MINLPVIDSSVKNKRVLVRGDIDIPEEDFTRLEAIKPTIDFLRQNNNTVILGGHLGRPEGKFEEKFSVKPVAEWFAQKILDTKYQPLDASWIDGRFRGFEINRDFVILENLRFFPEEENNDSEFAQELAALGEVYVNEAFATCERAHASIVGVPPLLPHYAGFRLAKEVEVLSKVLEEPARPLAVFIGGIKWETKEAFAAKMKMAADLVVVSKEISSGPDVPGEIIDRYQNQITAARTIIWNGPFGKVEDPAYQNGSRRLAELIAGNKTAFKIVGGGDTVAFLQKLGVLDRFDWVSTGGGSMLKFLSGEKLPGIEALTI
jgi:phosphoglycerate kinase